MGLMTERNLRGSARFSDRDFINRHQREGQAGEKSLYMEYGVKEFWIVDPDKRAIEVMVLKEDRL